MVALGLLLALGLLAACQPQVRLRGTDLGGMPAQDFQLADQHGRAISLSDFRGSPVVLTFLYTTCPDVCPLTAERLRLTANLLGGDAERVAMLAVSTDPEQDTPEAAARFVAAHGLQDRMHYLVGRRAELEPVWKAYFVAAVAHEEPGVHGPVRRVGHTDAVFLIDKQGRLRSLLRSDFDHAALAEDLRALLRE
jgi:protein SCO1/2